MKRKLFLYILLIALAACSKDKDILELSSDRVFNLGTDEQVLRIGIKSSSEWNITNKNTWCATTKVSHEAGDSLVITVGTNIAREKRSGEITISNKGKRLTLAINQAAATGEYHFKLPVIFHVLYTDASDTKQNIPAQDLQEALEDVNAYFNGTINRNPEFKPVDMNLEFTLATHDPNGVRLQEAGIHRVYRDNIRMGCEDFLHNKFDDSQWLWDQNKYINVVIFSFAEDHLGGISFLAYTPSAHALEGLPKGDDYYTSLPTEDAHCVALNNLYADKEYLENGYIHYPTGESVWGFPQIIAHELGHYLGLHHVFSEGAKVESDYCEDTPDYNRAAYEEWLDGDSSPDTLIEAYQRISRDGNTFESTNTMDYDLGWLNLFTPDQRVRVRHVLEYSPLVPGPKIPSTLTRGAGITEPGIIMK